MSTIERYIIHIIALSAIRAACLVAFTNSLRQAPRRVSARKPISSICIEVEGEHLTQLHMCVCASCVCVRIWSSRRSLNYIRMAGHIISVVSLRV